jgi:pyruvate decarboxylase
MSTQTVASLQAELNRLRHELRTSKAEEQVPAAGKQITIADYLLERLAELDVRVCLLVIPILLTE